MASDLTLLDSFVDGQGAGASTYTAYAPDLDSNFAAIETTVNQINAEVKAFSGNNALLALDLMRSSTPGVATGIVGAGSYAPVAFISGNTQIQAPAGISITGTSGRVETFLTSTLTGSGTSGARFVALQTGGGLTLETAAATGELDLYEINWNGASFDTGTISRLPAFTGDDPIFVDGEDLQNAKLVDDISQGTSAAVPAFAYDRIDYLLEDINALLAGLPSAGSVPSKQTSLGSGSPDQGAINPIAIGGSTPTPGMIIGNPTDGYRTSTGLAGDFASNSLRVTVEGILTSSWDLSVASEPQFLIRTGTDLTAPTLSFIGDLNSGLGWVSSDVFRGIVGGVEAFRFEVDGANGVRAAFVGDPDTGSNPGLAVIGDLDTGFLSQAADTLEMMLGGTVAAGWNLQRQRTSATQGRASATRTTQNVASGTALVNVTLNTAEQYDQGAYHDLVTNPDRMTVPTGFDGAHSLCATCSFDESSSSSPNAGDRDLAITINGTVLSRSRAQAAAANDTDRSVSIEVELAAGDIVRMAVAQDSGGAMDVVSSRLTVRLVD